MNRFFDMLPREIMSNVYGMDMTYHTIYTDVLEEIELGTTNRIVQGFMAWRTWSVDCLAFELLSRDWTDFWETLMMGTLFHVETFKFHNRRYLIRNSMGDDPTTDIFFVMHLDDKYHALVRKFIMDNFNPSSKPMLEGTYQRFREYFMNKGMMHQRRAFHKYFFKDLLHSKYAEDYYHPRNTQMENVIFVHYDGKPFILAWHTLKG